MTTGDLLQNVLDFVRDRHSQNGADGNWVIVGEIADRFDLAARAALDAAYTLESQGCVRITPSPDGNERGAVVQFVRPMSVIPATTTVFNIHSVGAIQTGSRSTATVNNAIEPAQSEPEPYSGPYDPARTPPFDRLPITDEMRRAMPSLHLEFGRVRVEARGFLIAWKVVNIGVGAAKRVRVFIPVLGMDEIGQPLQPGQAIIRKRPFPANFPYLKPTEDVVTLEFEDFAGRQYRQYCRLLQYDIDVERYPNSHGLRSMETGSPYHVKKSSLADHTAAAGVDTLPPALESWYFG